jgi:branched-subunit amino acid aminotransferase/4-amino-4-deoxychorismate lyase
MDGGGIICVSGNYVQAREAAVPAADEGFLYGMGLFETIRVVGGRPRLLDRHLARLFNSAGELGMNIPFGPSEIAGMVCRTAEANRLLSGGLRLTLTAGGPLAGPNIVIQARSLTYREGQYKNGVRAGFASFRRNESSPLVKHKTLNYYENILARREARAAGWEEALFLNTSGNLAEGSVSNIFLVDGEKVVTPSLQCGLLPGITRQQVIEICAAMQVPVEERTVCPGELAGAGECFITNSLMGVMPVIRAGETVIGNGTPGRVTGMLMAELEKRQV